MGLPLFVAPVESDVARKSSQKNATTSPVRTTIRRADRVVDRERRNAARRAAARIYGPVQRTLSNFSQERPTLPWPESGAGHENGAPVGGLEERLRTVQQSLRRNQRMEEHMATVIGTSWHDLPPGPPAEEEHQETDTGGWLSLDPRGRARRPRMITPISSRFTRSPDPLAGARGRGTPTAATTNSAQVTGNVRPQRLRPTDVSRYEYMMPTQLPRNDHIRQRTPRRGAGVDGLGDRVRSLSPEGWDTLLTTLAPDPQPPSANTSFASGTGTQSASQPSIPRATGSSILPDGFDDSPLDAGCDSGGEHSDFDEAGLEEPRHILYRQHRREQMRQNRVGSERRDARQQPRERVSNNDNSPRFDSGSRLRHTSRPGRENSEAPSRLERQAFNGLPMPAPISEATTQRSLVGRALGQASETEDTDAGASSGTVTVLSSMTSASGEEDLAGMQHIMRNMVQREDIPDDWWAEAGLSRTLSRQGAN